MLLIAKTWFNDNDCNSCDRINAIYKIINKYPMDAEGMAYINKRMGVCRKKVCGYCFY